MFEDIEQILLIKSEVAILDFITNKKHIDKIKENHWDIIPSIIHHINDTTLKDYPKFYESVLKVVDVVADHVDPDDMLLILVKEIEDTKEDTTFLILLNYLKIALLKLIPKNKINYLAWSLNTIQIYINQLPAPENLNLEGREKLLMDADTTVARISVLYYELLPFYDSLVSVVLSRKFEDHRILLLRSILQLLGHPIIYLDMDIQDKPKSKARLVAEYLVHKVIALGADTYSFLEDNFCNHHDDIKIKPICLSAFYYLHLAENIGLERSPKVYDPIYIFQNSLVFVVPILIMEHQFIIEKGLKLMSHLLNLISSYTLPYQLLDADIHCQFCKSITNIINYNPMESYRKRSLKILHDYLYKFDSRGRYLLIYNITRTIDNISLTAYIITQYKEMLVEQFDENKDIDYYFRGSKLTTLLSMFCCLPESIETDLIKSADQIIASLNLIRYLVLRDKANITSIQSHLKPLQESYLDPLKQALIVSKAHYNLRLKEITDESADGDKFDTKSKMSVSIAGKYLPELTTVEKVNVINLSITALDVIDSLLSRLNECIDYTCNVIMLGD